MTRPTKPTDRDGVVEMDAMDVHEWEQGQSTPQASDANLAALVKQSAHASGPVAAGGPALASNKQVSRGPATAPRLTAPGGAGPASQRMPAAKPTGPIAKPAPPTAKPTGPIAKQAAPIGPVAKPAAPAANPSGPIAKQVSAAETTGAAQPASATLTPIAKPSVGPALLPIGPVSQPIAKPAPTARPADAEPRPLPGVARAKRDSRSPRGAQIADGLKSTDPSLPPAGMIDDTWSPPGVIDDPEPADKFAAFDSFTDPTRVASPRPETLAASLPSHAPRFSPDGSGVGAPLPATSAPRFSPDGSGVGEPLGPPRRAGSDDPFSAVSGSDVLPPAPVPPMQVAPVQPAPLPYAPPLQHAPMPPAPMQAAPMQAAPLHPAPVHHEVAPMQYPLAMPAPMAPPRPRVESAERSVAEPPRRHRRGWVWLAAGAGVIATGAIVLALSGHGSSAPTATDPPTAGGESVTAEAARPAPSAAAKPAPTATATRTEPARPPAGAERAAPASPVAPAPIAQRPDAKRPAAAAEPSAKPAPKRVAVTTPTRRPARKAGKGKKVVVEYEGKTPAEVPSMVARSEEGPAIGRARSAYVLGNQMLFAGDTAGAIASYREALALYPGYVGGYRGLGLAFAQRGEPKQALDAFKTYVATVPNAKDVPLIKKRIARLERASARPQL